MADHDDPNEVFDTHAGNYSEEIDKTLNKYGASHDFFTEHKSWLISNVLQRMGKDPANMSLLDVGCGVGKIHAHLKHDFRALTGVDVSEPSIEVAREIHPEVTYHSYSGHRLPADDASVDMSLAICVFHHVPPDQWAGFASEMLRVLRPGGVAMVIEHNPYNPVTRRIVNTCPLDEDAVLLPARRLRGLFADAGGAGVTTRMILSVPPKTALLQRADLVLGHLRMGAQYYLTARKAGDAGR